MTSLWNKIFTKQTNKPIIKTCGTFMGLKPRCFDSLEEDTAIEYSNALCNGQVFLYSVKLSKKK